jgi:(5-formylfuran-3-yl)methyl phosphate synthase
MRLLVSVRSAFEVVPALQGGADIIDAKEPANGSLGQVSGATLLAIARRVPEERGLSIALGDLTNRVQLSAAIERMRACARTGDTYVKLGFAGLRSPGLIGSLLAEAVGALGAAPGIQLVAVAYADHVRAGACPPDDIAQIASEAGTTGVLLDTFIKDEGNLLSWLSPPELDDWVAQIKGKRLLAALAGSLQGHSLEVACAAQPDIIGVRGAACVGGRSGRVDRDRVRGLRTLMRRPEAVTGDR